MYPEPALGVGVGVPAYEAALGFTEDWPYQKARSRERRRPRTPRRKRNVGRPGETDEEDTHERAEKNDQDSRKVIVYIVVA